MKSVPVTFVYRLIDVRAYSSLHGYLTAHQ